MLTAVITPTEGQTGSQAPVIVSDVDPVAAVAAAFVDSGRVVPGLTVEGDGRARSWWWPLPAAEDRPAIRSLLTDSTPEAHGAAAAALAERVDALVRGPARRR